MKVPAKAWITDADGNEWADGRECSIEVEVTDVDEVRLGVALKGDGIDNATVFLSRSEADKLARFLAAASADDSIAELPQ